MQYEEQSTFSIFKESDDTPIISGHYHYDIDHKELVLTIKFDVIFLEQSIVTLDISGATIMDLEHDYT